MADFVNVNIKVGNNTQQIRMEKGVVFENNGGKYTIDANGQLMKFDKKSNVWVQAKQIDMTKYQWSAFQNLSDNDGQVGTYSKRDIQLAQAKYRKSGFTADMQQDLPAGYRIESSKLNSAEGSVQVHIAHNKIKESNATLKFQIAELADLKAASEAYQADKAQEKPISKGWQKTPEGIPESRIKRNPNKKKDVPDAATHTVAKGDSLYSIARKFGVSVKELMAANGLRNNNIKPGDVLRVPKKGQVGISPTSSGSSSSVAKVENGLKYIEPKGLSPEEKEALKTRPYIRYRVTDANGKPLPNVAEFKPTKIGDLSGKTIMVNAGHGYKPDGTRDPGTPGRNGLNNEWIINYDNAMRLKDELVARGANVVFVQGERALVERYLDENKEKYKDVDLFFSVHVNAQGGSNTKDRSQFYCRDQATIKRNGKTIASMTNANKQESMRLANILQVNLDPHIKKTEKIAAKDRYINEKSGQQDYAEATPDHSRTGILVHASEDLKCPAVLWEVAYMTTSKGRERLSNDKLMNGYAKNVSDSIAKYLVGRSTNRYHHVEKGDTVGNIARKYDIPERLILEANGMTNAQQLELGKILDIPENESG